MQKANIVVNDGKATPVAHTFSPDGPDVNGTQTFSDRVGGIPIGFPRLKVGLKPPLAAKPNGSSTNDRQYIAKVQTILPVLEVVSNSTVSGIPPAPTKAYECVAITYYYMPERSTPADRKDLRALHANALANALVTTVVQDLENIW